MKTISIKTIAFAVVAALFVAVFLIIPVTTTNACDYYDSCGYYDYPSTYFPPVYTPPSNNFPPTTPTYDSLSVTCYPMPLSAKAGESVTWYASASGGNNSYIYSWTGDEGLSGYGQSIAKSYNGTGYKNASVRVTSHGQAQNANCSGSVQVYGSADYINPIQPYPSTPYPPVYYPPTPTYYSLNVSCNANTTYAQVNNSVTWSAYATGGTGSYSYTWSGTDGLYGSGSSAYFTYRYPGQKYATVTVYSNGQSVTRACSNSVNISGITYVPAPTPIPVPIPVPIYPIVQNSLDIGCYVDPGKATVNQPVNWSVEATGGLAPYTYSWTGSNGLTGNQSTVIKYYTTAGQKSAIVSVTSRDGKTATRACSNTVTIKGTGIVKKPVVKPVVVVAPPPVQTTMTASSWFSLSNIPWGWVAILVILLLFATVIYLIFNREKI